MSGRKSPPERSSAIGAGADQAEITHAACIDAWLERSGQESSDARLQLFEAAFGALWARTATTLGEVTLTAIAERVLYNASETFPLFSSLQVEVTGGLPFRMLRKKIGSTHDAELAQGARFVLVEFLTVLGNLTADILTPELHAELSRVTVPGTVRAASSGAAALKNLVDPGEGADGEHETS